MSRPQIATFDVSDIEPSLSDNDKIILADTILAWADFETGVTYFIFLVFGLDFDAGSILLERMDLKTKLMRIKSLHEHHNKIEGAKSLRNLISNVEEFSASRNVIAHRKCIGSMISQPTRLVFMSSQHVKKQPGTLEILCVDHSELIASANFARQAAKNVKTLIDAIEQVP
jgi:hypothetical protein